MKVLAESFSSLLFPTCCLHCKGALCGDLKLLCQDCLDLIELIDPKECTATRAFCFDYEGPQKSLLTAFKYGDKPYLAKSLASFMLLQLERLDWTLPDAITYIPQSFLRSTLRGYNQSKLLAEELARFLDIPCLQLLSRSSFTISQTLLTKDARKELNGNTFIYKGPPTLDSIRLMLIDDVLTTGTTVDRACSELMRFLPKDLTVFCLMRAESLH